MFGDFDELDEQLDQAAAQALGETVTTKTEKVLHWKGKS